MRSYLTTQLFFLKLFEEAKMGDDLQNRMVFLAQAQRG